MRQQHFYTVREYRTAGEMTRIAIEQGIRGDTGVMNSECEVARVDFYNATVATVVAAVLVAVVSAEEGLKTPWPELICYNFATDFRGFVQ